ncbi:MAG: glycosyltransferase [Bacteroidetes bacterium]|nr:glycosyltransferase [Bacteroidota bacterium]
MVVIYLILLITCFVQIAYYLAIYSRFLKLDDSAIKLNIASCKPVSIVICAKNEARNLKKFLPIVLNQNYPLYEVIVVDDGSMDNTPKIMSEMEDIYEHLLSFRIEPEDEQHAGKKQALKHGVSLAKFDWILVTDADCCPGSNLWLNLMTQPLAEGRDIVLGISPYFGRKGFLNDFFRVEALFIAMQYVGFALSGLPYMGVGRNMSYKRKVFEQHDMSEHWDLVSGDDDLFINDAAQSADVAICPHKDAYTYSDAPITIRRWYRQKVRHYSAGHRYNLLQKIWLGYYWLSSLSLFLLLPVVIFIWLKGYEFSIFLTALLGITIPLRWAITVLSIRKFGLHNLSWSVPIFDVVYILSVWILSPLSVLSRQKWK